MRNLWKSAVAVIAGNAVYFLLLPHLPIPARHVPGHLDLGLAVDFCFCLVAYGIVDLIGRHRAGGRY